MRVAPCLFLSITAAVGCARMLGIDGEYELRQGNVTDSASSSGGQIPTGEGGNAEEASAGGTGGVAAPGGSAGLGGSDGGTGGSGGVPHSDAGSECPGGQKRCNGNCVTPDPSVGCTLGGCEPCTTAPANGYSICVNQQCEFDCKADYTRTVNDTCDPIAPGTGGAVGTGGTGVGPKHCTSAASCQKCGPFPGCCNLLTYCGCLYPANPICI